MAKKDSAVAGTYTETPGLGSRIKSTAAALLVDGVPHALEGEPPIAQSKGWGERPHRHPWTFGPN